MHFWQKQKQTPEPVAASDIIVGIDASARHGLHRLRRFTMGHPGPLIVSLLVVVLIMGGGIGLAAHFLGQSKHKSASEMATSGKSRGDAVASDSQRQANKAADKAAAAGSNATGGTASGSAAASGGAGGSTSSSGGTSGGGASANCTGTAHHVPGGVDGTGTCWPGPNNTGVPSGTVLGTYSGPCVITTANTVIDSKTVNCDLAIHAANVVIKNSKVNGQLVLDTDLSGSSAWSFTLQDSEVDAGQQQIAAVSAGNMTVLRSNIHGGVTAVQCEEKSVFCSVQDSYLHGQYIPDNQPWHLGGFLSDGGQNMTIKHNFIVCDHAVNAVDEGCTGDLNLIPNFAAINGILIEHNLFGANIGSSYCTYGGEKLSSPTPHSYNVVYKNNVFQRGSNGKCAAYGAVTGFEIGNAGNQWIGNKWDDGTTVDPEN